VVGVRLLLLLVIVLVVVTAAGNEAEQRQAEQQRTREREHQGVLRVSESVAGVYDAAHNLHRRGWTTAIRPVYIPLARHGVPARATTKENRRCSPVAKSCRPPPPASPRWPCPPWPSRRGRRRRPATPCRRCPM